MTKKCGFVVDFAKGLFEKAEKSVQYTRWVFEVSKLSFFIIIIIKSFEKSRVKLIIESNFCIEGSNIEHDCGLHFELICIAINYFGMVYCSALFFCNAIVLSTFVLHKIR